MTNRAAADNSPNSAGVLALRRPPIAEERPLNARPIIAVLTIVVALRAAAARAQPRIEFPSFLPDSGATAAPLANPPSVYQPQVQLQPVQPAPPAPWDPYAGAAGQPVTAAPNTPYYQPGSGPPGPGQRLIQKVSFDYTWLPGDGGDDFDVNDLEFKLDAAVPFFLSSAPLIVEPGFAFRYFAGPDDDAATPSPDMPPRVYDAFLGAGWSPQITPQLAAELGARVGVYSDFRHVESDAIRISGLGYGVITLSDRWTVKIGVIYTGMNSVHLIPAGGVIWTPNRDTRWELLFPSAKVASRLTTIGNSDVWWYFQAEWAGGAWTVRRALGKDEIDYRDIRVSGGIEWVGFRNVKYYIEGGFVFERHIEFDAPTPDFDPDNTAMIQAGIAF